MQAQLLAVQSKCRLDLKFHLVAFLIFVWCCSFCIRNRLVREATFVTIDATTGCVHLKEDVKTYFKL